MIQEAIPIDLFSQQCLTCLGVLTEREQTICFRCRSQANKKIKIHKRSEIKDAELLDLIAKLKAVIIALEGG